MTTNYKRVNVLIEPKKYERIRKIAFARHSSISSLIRDIVDAYFKIIENSVRKKE